jgi:hypothetical protein
MNSVVVMLCAENNNRKPLLPPVLYALLNQVLHACPKTNTPAAPSMSFIGDCPAAHTTVSLWTWLVSGTNRVNQVMRRNLSFRRASKHRTNLDLFKLVVF